MTSTPASRRPAAQARHRRPRPAVARSSTPARPAAVSSGVGVGPPGVRRARRWRHPRRRRRQPPHRLRLRHRGHHGRQRAPARRGRRAASRSPTSPTPASWSRPTRSTSRSARRSPSSPRRPREAQRAVQLRRRGRRERRQDRPRVHRSPGGGRLRARLPRPHEPDDGADRQEHALQARASVRSRPRSTGRRWPTRCAGPAAPSACADEAFDAFVDTVHTQVGESNVAAVVIEPIQGEGGFIVPPEGWLPRVAEFCAEHGIVLIADEIQTGFCRTGDWFACDHEGVVPDLITTAKGIAGGLPLAGGHRPRRDDGLRARRRPRRHLRRQPGRLRRRPRRDRDDEGARTSAAGRRRSRRIFLAAAGEAARRSTT